MLGPGSFPDLFQMGKISLIGHAQQTGVEEGLRCRHDDLAIAIVLHLLIRRVADANRPVATIAGEALCFEFVQFGIAHHRIERLDLAPARLIDDVAKIGEVFLQHVQRAEPVQGLHRVVAVPYPAVAIVPVPLASGRFGYRRGQGCHDRPGFFMLAQLEGDGGTNDLFLPFERDVKAAHPVLPVSAGVLFHPPHFAADVADEGFVGPEEEVLVAFDAVAAIFKKITHRSIGGQADGLGAEEIADVVGAVGGFGQRLAVILHRRHAHPQARGTGDGPHDPGESDRAIHAARPFEPRREVEDIERAAVFRLEARHQDRRIAHVMLAGGDLPFQLEAPRALVPPVAIEQRTEHRIAIDPRHTAPDEAPLGIDQRADLAIADWGKFEIRFVHMFSQLCTAATSSR